MKTVMLSALALVVLLSSCTKIILKKSHPQESPFAGYTTWLIKKGNHGYDNREKDMWAIFYATGPAFKKGYVQQVFPNISIYPLIAYLLGIQIPPADGKLRPVRKMLK